MNANAFDYIIYWLLSNSGAMTRYPVFACVGLLKIKKLTLKAVIVAQLLQRYLMLAGRSLAPWQARAPLAGCVCVCVSDKRRGGEDGTRCV